jgi:hypothetical protein
LLGMIATFFFTSYYGWLPFWLQTENP